MWILCLSVAILSAIQIQITTGCTIQSATSPTASSLLVTWQPVSGAIFYALELKVMNSTASITPVTVTLITTTQRVVQGLRPGHFYEITLTAYNFLKAKLSSCQFTGLTVPNIVTFTGEAVSSTSIRFEWTNVTGADNYTVHVTELFKTNEITQTFSTLSGEVTGLDATTTYNCYITAANSAGNGAKGTTRAISTLVPPPVEVNVTSTGKSTANVTWSKRSGVIVYQVTVTDTDTSNPPVTNQTGNLYFNISNLEPCSNYTIGISSLDSFLKPGEPNQVHHVTSSINPVTTITIQYSCSDATVKVTWDQVFGANSYVAKVTDSSGESLNCTSASTTCVISMLKCGEKYTAHVTVISDDCSSSSTVTKMFDTVPCAPANPTIQYSCANLITFTWEKTNNTSHYEAKSTDLNNAVRTCTTQNNGCFFSNVDCGQQYSFTVQAISSECNSAVTEAKVVKTSPCIPQNISTTAVCNSGKLITTWNAAAGAEYYTVSVLSNEPSNDTCTTNSTTCEVTGFPCGNHATVRVTASNENCTTPPKLGTVGASAPCTPTNVTASNDCDPDNATVTWVVSKGVLYYIVIAEDSSGRIHACYSTDPTCNIQGLTCGQTYTAKVIGTNIACNSSDSNSTTFTTASCPPTNVTAVTNCNTNQALITWDHPATGSYAAIIKDSVSGDTLNCSSNSTKSCTIPSIPCGKTYAVTVSYDDGRCPSTSSPASMNSVPCQPTGVSVQKVCLPNNSSVSWTASDGSTTYTARAVTSGGLTSTCGSAQTSCSFSDLQCGQVYDVTVSGVRDACTGPPSTSSSLSTEPCSPVGLTSQVDCKAGTAAVSWTSSANAANYTVKATYTSGSPVYCYGASTNCTLTALNCNQQHTVTVTASDDTCTSAESQSINQDPVPCAPQNVQTSLNCSTNDIMVTWNNVSVSWNYNVTAVCTSGQTPDVTCTSSSNSCTLTGLQCGQNYSITAVAFSGSCVGAASSPVIQSTGPCGLNSLTTNLSCGSNDLQVSLSAGSGASNHTVTVSGPNGFLRNCTTTNLSCQFTGLDCATQYNISTVSGNGHCSSPPNNTVITTGPCDPTNINSVLNCSTDSATVSWNAGSGAVSYRVTTVVMSQPGPSCTSTTTSCELQQLNCGKTYNLTVTSESPTCNSTGAPASLTTAPCPPTGLSNTLICGTSTSNVSWTSVPSATGYVVNATTAGGLSDSCTSASSSTTVCTLSNLQCSENYTATVVARGSVCDSGRSNSITISTVPCPPSISTQYTCSSNSATVTWTKPAGNTGFYAEISGGHSDNCNTTSASCVFQNIPCGLSLNLKVKAKGHQCDSEYSNADTFDSAPCTPSNISVSVDCKASVATVSWQSGGGAQSFVTELKTSDHADRCSSNSSSCQPSHLHCGEEYNVSVTAVGGNCNATGYMASNFYTEPCNLTGVAVNYTVGSALIQWSATKGATSYSSEAVSDQGAPSVCNSSSTTHCTVSGLQCSEHYNVTVSAFNQACDSRGVTSDTVHITTEPCPPTNVRHTIVCGQLGVNISWNQSEFAVGYIAYINNTNGIISNCEATSSESSCVISGLVCGSVYSAWAIAKGAPYNSSSSNVITFKSEPCLPQSIAVQVDCNSDGAATVSWTASAGVNYSVCSVVGGNPQTLCTTQQGSCAVSGLSCGQNYSLSLHVIDNQCNLTAANQWSLSTRPCAPSQISTSRDCASGNVTVTWQPSVGADSYIATVISGSGVSQSCTSQSTPTCSISGLVCGQNYNVSVTASNGQCNVTSSEPVSQATAPCAPTNVNAMMNCTTDTALVSWGASVGATTYKVTGHSTQNPVSCDSSGLFCPLTNLACGRQYAVHVVANDSECSSASSQNVTLTTAPCAPENVNASINCATNDLIVSWDSSAHAEHYLVSAVAQNGGSNGDCNVTSSPCTVSNVSCGNTFNVQVTAVRGSCQGQPSTSDTALSAPCQPLNVSGIPDCVRNSARISWMSALGANGYTVHALGERNLRANCSTSTNTTCEIELECATRYNFTVTATNGQCESPASAHLHLETAPCSLTGIRAYTQCHNSTILVEWDLEAGGTGDTVYTATAEDSNNMEISCNSTGNSCYLQNAQCGLRYTIVVSATSDICNDLRSPPHHITTEPCRPNSPTVANPCGAGALVSWSPSPVAETYSVFAVADDGHQHICNSTINNCTFTDLHCDEQYSVYVVAKHENCSSLASSNATLRTSPCKPDNVSGTYYCNNLTAMLTWSGRSNAVSYYASAVDENGNMLYCTSNTSSCNFAGLQYGSKYNFTVLATDGTCNTSYSDPSDTVGAVPCPPDGVAVQPYPMGNNETRQTLRVSWTTSNNTEYQVALIGPISGTPTLQFEISSYWTPRNHFELPVPCGSDYNGTVVARNSAGTSHPSTISGSTDSCSSPSS